jgi:transposase-like protein
MAQVGRPTDYSEEKLALARQYLDGGWEDEGDAVPQIAGLAMAMDVHRSTIYEWAEDADKKEFADIFTRVKQMQERKLVNNGLAGTFNPAITKMMLTKHGYSDKIEQAHTSPDGSLGPTRIVIESANGSDSQD